MAIIEREEGLFTQHGLTRALCIVALLGLIPVFATILLLIYSALRHGSTAAVWRYLYPSFWLIFASYAAFAVLWLWRKCARCGRRLFSESRRSWLVSIFPKPQNRLWSNRISWMQGLVEPERDFRAKTLLGSYRSAAIVGMALTGRLRCQWCNHEDGVKPDYVVTSAQ
jgi:hypothetical protein